MSIESIKNLCFNDKGAIKSPNHSRPVFLINNKIYDEVMELTSRLPEETLVGARLKFIFMDCPEPNLCLRCSKPTQWLQQEFKYNYYCSRACANLDKNSDPNFILKIKRGIAKVDKQKANNKRRETTQFKYGVNHVLQLTPIHEKIRETRKETDRKIRENTFKKYNLDINLYENVDYLKSITSKASSYSDLSNRFYNKMPVMTILRHFIHLDFDPKYEKQTSAGEKEVGTFLQEIGVSYQSNNRSIIKPLELDIVFPEKKIAIEYNGVYWHTERKGYDKTYHIGKMEMAAEKGYNLIHMFENNWVSNKNAVKNFLISKLGLSKKIGARKTAIVEIDSSTANQFCEKNHIQGSTKSSYNLGLVYNNEIVSVATFGLNRFISDKNTFELIRYCSSYGVTVVGGLSKLLKKFSQDFPGTQLISYCDRGRSNGNSYLKSGWFLHHISAPGYQYTKHGKVFNRQQFQKHKLTSMPLYSPEKTEWQIMQESGYDRIWDCGQLVFYKQF